MCTDCAQYSAVAVLALYGRKPDAATALGDARTYPGIQQRVLFNHLHTHNYTTPIQTSCYHPYGLSITTACFRTLHA